MLRFKDQTTSPPGSYYIYVQPETNQEFRALNLRKLGEMVKAHRVANLIPIGVNFNAEIEDAAARKILELYPTYTGIEQDSGVPIKQGWTLGDVLAWAYTMIEWVKRGMTFVSQEQANERAAICKDCPKNIDIAGCFGCSGVAKLIPLIRGSRSTPFDDKLKICGACGCVLKVKIFVPSDVIEKTYDPSVPYWENCWIRTEKAGQ